MEGGLRVKILRAHNKNMLFNLFLGYSREEEMPLERFKQRLALRTIVLDVTGIGSYGVGIWKFFRNLWRYKFAEKTHFRVGNRKEFPDLFTFGANIETAVAHCFTANGWELCLGDCLDWEIDSLLVWSEQKDRILSVKSCYKFLITSPSTKQNRGSWSGNYSPN